MHGALHVGTGGVCEGQGCHWVQSLGKRDESRSTRFGDRGVRVRGTKSEATSKGLW